VQSVTEDELNRADFAASITEAIVAWAGEESLVIGVQGRWGTGKSSLKYLIQENLDWRFPPLPARPWWARWAPRWLKRRAFPADSRWLTLSFTPWEWPDPGAVHQTFYAELGKVLGRKNVSEQHKKAATRLKRYADVFSVKELTDTARTLGVSAVALLAALGITFAVARESLWAILFAGAAVTMGVVLLLGLGFRLFGTIRAGFAEKYRLSAAEEHAELVKVMKTLPQGIVVFIDEIDRLNGQELRSLFSLLKLNANLPNLVFVLFYDASVVEQELGLVTQGSPRAFLEKVIQLPFTVPAIDDELLINYVLKHTADIFSSPAATARFRLQDEAIYLYELFWPFIRDLRQAKRFLASLSFHARLFEGAVYEVHPRDLFLVELLRVFEPRVHAQLAQSRSLALGAELPMFAEQPSTEDALKPLLALAADPKSVNAVLTTLFRHLSGAHPMRYSDLREPRETATLFHEARIAHYDVFPRYFQLVISSDQIPFSTMDQFFTEAVTREAVTAHLQTFKENDQLGCFTKGLDQHKARIPGNVIPALVGGLLDFADEFEDDPLSFTSPMSRVERVLFWMFRDHLPDTHIRDQVLWEALQDVTSLYLPIRLIRLLAGDKDHERLISEAVQEKGTRKFVKRIRTQAISGELVRDRHLLNLLFRWREADPRGEPQIQNWVQEMSMERSTWTPLIKNFIAVSSINGMRREGYSDEAHTHFLAREDALKAWEAFNVDTPTEEEAALVRLLKQPPTDRPWRGSGLSDLNAE
jgi:hypothetical protein